MTFTIKLLAKGRDVFTGVLPNMDRNFRGGIRAALLQGGFSLVKTAKDGMQRETKTGAIVKRKGRRARRASAAGQYPGISTGQTIQGVDMKIRGSDQLEFGIMDRTGGSKDVPTFLEDGTSKMAPRPTLALANEAREKELFNWLRRIPLQRVTQG